ncbi:tetratricopeptide repeat protein [Lentzea atacamensis]|uniref:Tetratricopeptide repeat protein n=1 Tax=Lentzea atacamensis TaxID=531938 RepID=A0ABX9E1V8_9PSEU|nr:tetratricopeptide repeat protein [Lentzea atacamensis]RAS61275.1 tetratricopeptide repeat protein [Lentzea atacamensis]
MATEGNWDRRSVLRAAAVMAGAAAATPLMGEAQAGTGGAADALFRAGKFEQAGRAYEEILRNDPKNVHAASRRGHVALLSNKFADAEKYLGTAVALAPGDQGNNRLLADCYNRQGKLSVAAPHWRAAGLETDAKWYEAVRGEPYQISGDIARLPWQQMDPIPQVEASVNGGRPRRFSFYTRVGPLSLSGKVAAEAGLQAVTKQQYEFEGRTMWFYYGYLESFRLGGVELRNLPVHWSDEEPGPDSEGGIFGTSIFQHFLTTIDYAGRSLILRRRTPEAARQVRAAAHRAGAEPLPLWLVREHLVFSRGSFAGSGPRVVGLNIGGTGSNVAGMSLAVAEDLRIRVDHDRPEESSAGGRAVVVHPCYPKEVRLGNATATGAYSVASERNLHDGHGFDVLGDIAHSFYKPYHVTLDFDGMQLYVARGVAG